MAGLEKRLKAPCRKLGRAGEEDIHGGGTRSGASGRLAELFLKFRLDALLLEARQIVDEDPALEVIHFVLDADREDFLCDEGEGLSVQAERAHGHALGALNRLVDSWNRQAALLAILDAFAADDLRVDQNQELIS